MRTSAVNVCSFAIGSSDSVSFVTAAYAGPASFAASRISATGRRPSSRFQSLNPRAVTSITRLNSPSFNIATLIASLL